MQVLAQQIRWMFLLGATGIALFFAAGYLGLLPSVSRTMGSCKLQATSRLATLSRNDSAPIDDPRNDRWFSVHAEMVQFCMEANGYKLDEKAFNTHILAFKSNSNGFHTYNGVQILEFWTRRWLPN